MDLATRWTQLDKRHKRLLLALGVLGAVWLSDAMILRPLRVRLSQLHRDVRQTEQRLRDALVATAQAEAVNQAFEVYQSYVQPSGSPESELASVLTEVESAVREAGMVLISLKPQSVSGSTAHAVSVTVETETSPAQLVQLLNRIQRSAHLLKVTELNVRVVEGRTLRASFVIGKLLLGPVG